MTLVGLLVAVFLLGILIQFVEPQWFGVESMGTFDFRAMLTDAIYVGSAVPVCGLLGLACWQIKRHELFDRASLVLIGMFIVAISLTGGRLWWLVWRDWAQPEWMRLLHTFWLFLTIIGGMLIFAGGETIHGRIAPRVWLTWLTVSGVAVTAILIAFVVIG